MPTGHDTAACADAHPSAPARTPADTLVKLRRLTRYETMPNGWSYEPK